MMARVSDRSGKVKYSFVVWMALIASGVFCGYQYGSVYFRKYQIEEMVQRELSYAGQRTDQAIRERVANEIAGMRLPPAARGFHLTRASSPRALQFSVNYVDRVNLVFTEKQVAVSVRVGRVF